MLRARKIVKDVDIYMSILRREILVGRYEYSYDFLCPSGGLFRKLLLKYGAMRDMSPAWPPTCVNYRDRHG